MVRIAISFDYDSPAGYRSSFHRKNFPQNADQEGTGYLLRVLDAHGVQATFGVVGHAALAGKPPEYCQDQIREIHQGGHEIASHSMTHAFLPALSDAELLREAVASKEALEACVHDRVSGLIPPFNRPMHFPARGAFSIAEMLGLHGRGRGRQSIGSLLRILKQAGYGWCRVTFENKVSQVMGLLRKQPERLPEQPFLCNGVVAIPLHVTGFGQEALAAIRRQLGTSAVITLYGHPNQALAANDQNSEQLDRFLEALAPERRQGLVQFNTMGEIEQIVRRQETRLRAAG